MSDDPLFDESGTICLRSPKDPQEGILLIEKIEAGTIRSLLLIDFLRITQRLGISAAQVENLLTDDDLPGYPAIQKTIAGNVTQVPLLGFLKVFEEEGTDANDLEDILSAVQARVIFDPETAAQSGS